MASIQELLKAAEAVVAPTFKCDKQEASKWTDEQKMAACPRNGGRGYGVMAAKAVEIIKDAFGGSSRVIFSCNMCEGCYKFHGLEYEAKMKDIAAKAEGGQWRRKLVKDDKESKALKKKISRNQDGRHVEFAAEQTGYNEILTYVKDGTKNADDYGELVNFEEDIDFDAVYRNNRATGKKFSVGKGFKPNSAAPADKKPTERVILPGILVDEKQADKAERLVQHTNYIEKATTFEEALRAYYKQNTIIIQELEKEGIEVIAIHNNYRNVDRDKFMEEWNNGRAYWELLGNKKMSTNAPLNLKENGANMDKVELDLRLYYPEK